jgi:hypothetical protein
MFLFSVKLITRINNASSNDLGLQHWDIPLLNPGSLLRHGLSPPHSCTNAHQSTQIYLYQISYEPMRKCFLLEHSSWTDCACCYVWWVLWCALVQLCGGDRPCLKRLPGFNSGISQCCNPKSLLEALFILVINFTLNRNIDKITAVGGANNIPNLYIMFVKILPKFWPGHVRNWTNYAIHPLKQNKIKIQLVFFLHLS